MLRNLCSSLSITLLACLSLLMTFTAASPVDPEADLHGLSLRSISSLNAALSKWVADKKGANVVTLLARNGKIVDQQAFGVLDASATNKVAVQNDTIFRIMSMTKPFVGVGMMIFHEQGKWTLDDPVSKHIPEFANLRVKTAGGQLVPQERPMTMAMLMSHSAGFPAMLTVNSPTLDGIIPPLVQGQLAFQPGTGWRYGPGVEIQGYLIQKWSGMDLSDFLDQKVFQPLGLKDTGFFIDASKVNRVSKLHTVAGGQLVSLPSRTPTTKPMRLSPSGGLLSTTEDYWKFSQMLLNNGTFNNVRILKPESVQLMHTNVLAPNVKVGLGGAGAMDGLGFGLDFAVVLNKSSLQGALPKDSYYWGGAYGTWFWNDPQNDVVFVGMIQNTGMQLSGDGSLRQVSAREIYADIS